VVFPRDQITELLKACHRRCCICHKFCGVKIEVDHIVPAAEGGPDDVDNAIPVCFDCHAEIYSYNDKHPRGRKFRPEELRGHKDQWLEICRTRPDIFINTARDADVGPMQTLIDELMFNDTVAGYVSGDVQGCLFHDEQFRRAIREGAIAILQDDLKQTILEAYVAIGRANQLIGAAWAHPLGSESFAKGVNGAGKAIFAAKSKVEAARDSLLEFLGSDDKEFR
jgi:hypothetical protein